MGPEPRIGRNEREGNPTQDSYVSINPLGTHYAWRWPS